jgi:hypothetical protein
MPELISSIPPPESPPETTIGDQIRELILSHINYQVDSNNPLESSKTFSDGTKVHILRDYKQLGDDEDLPVFDPDNPDHAEDLNQQVARMETTGEEIVLFSVCNGEPMILRVTKDGPYELFPNGPISGTRRRILDIPPPE